MLANRRSLNFTKFHSYILNPLIDKKNYSYLKLVSTGNPSIDNANVKVLSQLGFDALKEYVYDQERIVQSGKYGMLTNE